MKNQVLSIEQMRKLKELGVDVSPVGVCFHYRFDGGNTHRLEFATSYCSDDIKAFTLQDILEMLPKQIDDYQLVIWLDDGYVRYETEIGRDDEGGDVLAVFDNTNIIQSAYEMLIWVAENVYLKTK